MPTQEEINEFEFFDETGYTQEEIEEMIQEEENDR